MTGLYSAWLFAQGDQALYAGMMFALSHFLDHTDGELARMANKGSRFGHIYDLASDALIMVLLFVSIGWGLQAKLGEFSLYLGIFAGVAIAIIFHLRHVMEDHHGKAATAQAHYFGFEVEDMLYLLPFICLVNGLPVFLIAAAVGAPIGACFVFYQYRKLFVKP